jgi:hypothetical protein
MLADENAGQLRGQWLELASNVIGGVWLGIEDIDMAWSALQVDQDNVLGGAGTWPLRLDQVVRRSGSLAPEKGW